MEDAKPRRRRETPEEKLCRLTEIERGLWDEGRVVAGIDDPCGFADRKTVDTLMAEIRQNEGESVYTVLLAHRNDMLDQAQTLGFDLVLSGHAHGGLIRLPGTEGLIGPNREWLPAYTGGLYTRGDTQMIVSRGIGNHTGVPRFLNCPHIPVAVLRPA